MEKSLIQKNNNICFYCQFPLYGSKDKHHVFNGPNRKKSEEDNLFVYLHHSCHMYIHDRPSEMRKLKKIGQEVFEKEIGTRDQFIQRYRKNYLEVWYGTIFRSKRNRETT